MSSPNYQRVFAFLDAAVARRAEPGVPADRVPSEYWLDAASHFTYLRHLPDSELQRIRRHTYHLTGDYYISYNFLPPQHNAAYASFYGQLADELGLQVEETSDGIGIETPRGRVSIDLIRYYIVLRDMVAADVIPRDTPVSVLEIGGGFGGLARVLLAYNPAATVVILDLEETLAFSAIYLTNMLGAENVVLVQDRAQLDAAPKAGKVFLVPQALRDVLEESSFDLAINQQSMQEMTAEQIQRYVDFLKSHATVFYCCNLPAHPDFVRTPDLVTDLHAILRAQLGPFVWVNAVGKELSRRVPWYRRLTRRSRRRLRHRRMPGVPQELGVVEVTAPSYVFACKT